MGTVIVLGVLVIFVIIALYASKNHLKGEGGCCGGGGSVRENKKLDAPEIGKKEIMIEGMHCENCKTRVERAVNKLDGAVCKVNLKKGKALVSYSIEPEDSRLTEIIEDLEFKVKSINKI